MIVSEYGKFHHQKAALPANPLQPFSDIIIFGMFGFPGVGSAVESIRDISVSELIQVEIEVRNMSGFDNPLISNILNL